MEQMSHIEKDALIKELVEALKAISQCKRTEELPVKVIIKMIEALKKAGSL